MSEMPLLQVKNLHTSFFTDAGEVKAVNGISYNLDAGKVLGIVGESGSGKSVSAYSVLRILTDTGRVTEGEVLFKGENILKYSEQQMQKFRGSRISIIFQDPMTCLNPTFSIGSQLRDRDQPVEPADTHAHIFFAAGRNIAQHKICAVCENILQRPG